MASKAKSGKRPAASARKAGRVEPSPRASGLREDRKDRMARLAKAEANRLDPVEAQRRAAEERYKADKTAPKPQEGLSSSELNTAPPGLKEQATKDAAGEPDNTFPKGSHKAGTDAAETGMDEKTQKHT